MKTVGVNAAQASDAVKFPRFTFGCVPRRREDREKRERWKIKGGGGGVQRGGGVQGGDDIRIEQRKGKKKGAEKRETGVKITAVLLGAGPSWRGAWLGVKVGGANEQNGGMKLSLQHNKDQKSGRASASG